MRIAYLGNLTHPWSTETDYRLGFEALGHTIAPLQENGTSPAVLRRQALDSELLLVTGTWDDAQPLDEFISTVHACARMGIPTATVHLDTFFPVSRGGRKWWLAPMMHTATIFTASGDDQEQWDRWGKRHVWLPPAVRHTVVEKCAVRVDPVPAYTCDVAFVGSDGRGYHEAEWPYRRELVSKLREICRRRRWPFKNPGGAEPKVDRSEMHLFYGSAKVTVGDSLCPKREASRYWSDRIPECTGRRGVLVMPRIDELQHVYPDMLTYEWGNWDDLEHQIETLLADAELRAKVADACYDVTAAGHTYKHRAQTILDTLGLGR